MSRRHKSIVATEDGGGSHIFQKISLLSDLTQAMTNKDLADAFHGLGKNGTRLYEIFGEAVYEEIEYLMKGEAEEVPQVLNDAAQTASSIYNTMQNLYAMMISLGNSAAMQPLNLIAQKMGGVAFEPNYQYQQPQQQYQPQQQQYQPQQPAPQYQQPPQPQYQQPAPQPQLPQVPPRQTRQQPAQQAPAPIQQRPAKAGRYSGGEEPTPQQAPVQRQRQQAKQQVENHGPPALTMPPRGNNITGLF